jgi:CBS domain-containing protein
MPRDLAVRTVMTTDVLTFSPDDNVRDAMAQLVDRGIDAGPVVDASGKVVGMLSTGDLIVQETQLHVPTVISLFGAYLELPSAHRHFETDLEKALRSTVAGVMTGEPVTISPDDTVERAATLMHDHNVSRLPVLGEDGNLIGIIARSDIVRAIVISP